MITHFRHALGKLASRRVIAGAFLLIALIEMGSHSYVDSHELAAMPDRSICRLPAESPHAHCPDRQRNKSPETNLRDEMTSHGMLLTGMVIPVKGVFWSTEQNILNEAVRPISRTVSPPFQPPKFA